MFLRSLGFALLAVSTANADQHCPFCATQGQTLSGEVGQASNGPCAESVLRRIDIEGQQLDSISLA